MKQENISIALSGAAVLVGVCICLYRRQPVGNHAVPQPNKFVNVPMYMGRWYEQFRYENPFEKCLDSVTAEYSLNEDGTVKIVNRGRKPGRSRGFRKSIGIGKIVDDRTNAKLKVSFFAPFYGDYWILDHAIDYAWSIVGEPSGRFLWALTRASQPTPNVLEHLQIRVKELGYDWSLVRVTKQ